MVDHKYRWDFIGLSTDSKPTASSPRVVNGSTYYEADTSKAYVWYKDQWYEKTATGGGGGGGASVKMLTTDDYNYPENNPNSVALWLLDAGVYCVDNASSLTTRVKVHSSDTGLYYKCSFFEVIPLPQSSYILINVYGNFSLADGDGYYGFRQYKVDQSGNESGHVVYTTTDDLNEVKPQILNQGSVNYPSNSPDGVAIWQLNPANYKINADEYNQLKIYFEPTTAMNLIGGTINVIDVNSGTEKLINFNYAVSDNGYLAWEAGWERVNSSTGSVAEMKMYTQESV